jgi:uncharacterized protein
MVEKQRQFFRRFLKRIDNRVADWPRVTLEVRERHYLGGTRSENEWPLARTAYTKYYLDAATGRLATAPAAAEAAGTCNVDRAYRLSRDGSEYSSLFLSAVDRPGLPTRAAEDGKRVAPAADRPAGGAPTRAIFEMAFTEDTELTGHASLRLWVSADASDDLDLFVALEKVDASGNLVHFPFFGNHDDGPVALGWLRVSHRELDQEASTPWQAVLRQARELKVAPGIIVPVDIEILPTSVLFRAGETLRLVVQGSDIYRYPSEWHTDGHLDTVDKGDHTLHTGSGYESFRPWHR